MAYLTKNQHFVPRLLLRHFTGGNNERVQIFDSNRNKVWSSSIRKVFSRNNFYDDDNAVEKFLAEKIEGPAATVVSSIVADPSRAIEPGLPALLTFIAVQMARTPSIQSQALDFVDGFSSMFFEQFAELNGHSIESVKSLKLRPSDERAVLNRLVLRSVLNRWLLEDLSWHVLSNGTNVPFVISDNPAVLYNWYLRDSDDPSHTGMTKGGVQIFLPLSPSVTLALIDKSVYKLGQKGSNHTVLGDKRDVELLNSLQFRSRQDFVVFSLATDIGYVKLNCAQIPANSLACTRAGRTDPISIGDNKLSSQIYVWRTQARYEQWLSVCRIKRRISKKAVECRDRRPEAMAAHMAAARGFFGSRSGEP